MGKLKFLVTEEGEEIIRRLAEEEKTSEEEVLKRALRLYRFIKEDVYKKGKKLGILDEDDNSKLFWRNDEFCGERFLKAIS